MAADHYHVTAAMTRKDGTTDRHRYLVSVENIDQERSVAKQMGYEVKSELCYDEQCLGRSLKP